MATLTLTVYTQFANLSFPSSKLVFPSDLKLLGIFKSLQIQKEKKKCQGVQRNVILLDGIECLAAYHSTCHIPFLGQV